MPDSALPLLVCPLTKQNLSLLNKQKAGVIKSALEKGELFFIDGTPFPADPGQVKFLISENGQHLYAVIDGVPLMLESRQIDLQRLQF